MDNNRSDFDLNHHYKALLLSLIDETNDVYNQARLEDCNLYDNVTISYRRNVERWYMEGEIIKAQLKRTKIEEHERLRKGTKNYFAIYRHSGKILKVESFVNGEKDVTWHAFAHNNKRYLIPFDKDGKKKYGYSIVSELSNGFIRSEYLVNDSQICYYEYNRISVTEVSVIYINYIPKSTYPVSYCDAGIVYDGELYSQQQEYIGYEEFKCKEKGVSYADISIPDCIVRQNK